MADRYALKLRFSGASVENQGLDLYDGATSFYGFAQALQIAVHAFTTGEVVSRATALRKAEMYFSAPRRGSVLFDILTVVEHHPVAIGASAPIFYDFMKTVFSRSVGYFSKKPDTPAVQHKLSVDETFFDHLAETLEGSLQRAHRAIDNGVPRVTLERPRSELVTFNQATSQWVNTREENPDIEEFTGSITRYNSVSGNGRVFVTEIGKIIPFRPAENFPENKRGFLTWSLHGNTTDGAKELRLWASKIESAGGHPKRMILADVATIQGQG